MFAGWARRMRLRRAASRVWDSLWFEPGSRNPCRRICRRRVKTDPVSPPPTPIRLSFPYYFDPGWLACPLHARRPCRAGRFPGAGVPGFSVEPAYVRRSGSRHGLQLAHGPGWHAAAEAGGRQAAAFSYAADAVSAEGQPPSAPTPSSRESRKMKSKRNSATSSTTRPACAITGSAHTACSSAPVSWRPDARRSSGKGSSRQASTGPSTALTPSSPSAAKKPAAPGKPPATAPHSDAHRLIRAPAKLPAGHHNIDAHPLYSAGSKKDSRSK